MDKPYHYTYFGHSDIGLTRGNNEDVWSHRENHAFFALADGMGGHNAGEVAAQEAVSYMCTSIEEVFHTSPKPWDTSELSSFIKLFIENANIWINHLAKEKEQCKGMGTTLCTLLFHQQSVILGHVGDSRIYRFRDQSLEQLTIDHSLKNELMKQGRLITPPSKNFRYKNVLTRAIGPQREVKPEIDIVSVLPGDVYLMCSDGLSDYVTDKEISSHLYKTASPEAATKTLIEAAKTKGGKDNITVVMVQVHEEESLLRQQRNNSARHARA